MPARNLSMDAKIDQLMDMMRGLTTRMDTLEARSKPTTSTLPTASATSAPPAPQPQSQSQTQSTLSIAQPISQQKKKRNEKTRQQYYKRRTLQQANTEQEQEESLRQTTTENIAEKGNISSSSSKASSIKTMSLLSTISAITPWFLQPYHCTMLVSPLAYIRFAEDMEVTGQG
ncbi:MAG: hypothetical protein ALECFALPRED_000521 [Alectoria fallacina]|uniref:Uncharacterized protein n=1 Tax=Alectoria fallacina TaxID=1903189 RepID=A0A8H3J9R8_9LECA|nr:MAG: hypothetical protein ALECFALPRED_000521 [Alectoria fallacina]